MRHPHHNLLVIAITGCLAAIVPTAIASAGPAFEGHINAVSTLGAESNDWLYTVGSGLIRLELTATNSLNPVDLIDPASGTLTLIFRHNQSFMRIAPASEITAAPAASLPAMPLPPGGLPPGIGPQSPSTLGSFTPAPGLAGTPFSVPNLPAHPAIPPGIGPSGSMPRGMPAMPTMPTAMAEKIELKATGQTTNLLGYTCRQYEIKQRWETMDIWATDQLPPFQPYLRNQPRHAGVAQLEDQWPALLTAQKLFPLLITLRNQSGGEHLRFQVTSLTPEQITDTNLFVPPPDYSEVQPLPF